MEAKMVEETSATFHDNVVRMVAAELALLNAMTAAREMFGRSYLSLGAGEKLAVDQAVFAATASNFQTITPEFLAGHKLATSNGIPRTQRKYYLRGKQKPRPVSSRGYLRGPSPSSAIARSSLSLADALELLHRTADVILKLAASLGKRRRHDVGATRRVEASRRPILHRLPDPELVNAHFAFVR
jgi:hypothetical protein